MYTESTSTRHVAVISGMDNVRAMDSFTFQCVYNRLNNIQVRSNKVQYYWGKLTLSCTLQSTSIYLHMQVLSCERSAMPHHEPVLIDCLSCIVMLNYIYKLYYMLRKDSIAYTIYDPNAMRTNLAHNTIGQMTFSPKALGLIPGLLCP